MNSGTKATSVTVTTILLVLMMIPAGMNHVPPLLAQTTETDEDTSSASQDYQEFQSCLSDAEVDGTVSEQQIRDCFAPIYNTATDTGTGTGSDDTTTSIGSPPSNGDTSSTENTEDDDDDEESGGAE